jgi:phosphatidylglycerol:prolipoprotein diacylglycerol transferase
LNPVAFSIGNFDVRWYGVIIASGIMLAFIITYINCKYREKSFDRVIDIFVISFIAAIRIIMINRKKVKI